MRQERLSFRIGFASVVVEVWAGGFPLICFLVYPPHSLLTRIFFWELIIEKRACETTNLALVSISIQQKDLCIGYV
jgi:hypothetical protein